jgi:hypothetical protein
MREHESGVSEIMGAVMLISVVVMGVAIIGVVLTSQPPPQNIPALDAVISWDGVDTIYITHNGGDSLQRGEFYVRVENVVKPFLKTNEPGNPLWSAWSAGETLDYKLVPPDTTPPRLVQLIYIGTGSSPVMLASTNFGTGGSTGMPTLVPTVIPTSAGAPAITGITPNAGTNGTTAVITSLTGLGFRNGATVRLTRAGQPDIPGTSVFFISPSQLSCVFSLNTLVTGSWNVVVTNPDGKTSNSYPFTINPPAPAPTVTSITPNYGNSSTTVTITNLAGTGFQPGAAVILMSGSYPNITATSVNYISPTQLTCTFNLAVATADVRNVVVTNTDGKSGVLNNGFTVMPPLAAPTFLSISPATGPTAGGTGVTITGRNLIGATSVTFGSTAATGITVVNETQITAITPSHAIGAVDVAVTTPNGTATGTSAYSYGIAPMFSSISPATGPTSGGTGITITGTNLTGATAVTFGGTAATGVTAVSDTSITATTPGHAAGAVDVVITTPNGTATGTGAYTYGSVPTFASITPRIGLTIGGTPVTITGTNLAGATSVTFGGTAATGVTAVSDTSITANTPFHAAGLVTVVVTTPNGTATGTNAYNYTTTAAPTFTSIAPSSGPTAGSTAVTITGTNFVAGGLLGVTIGGAPATSVVRSSATTITAVTPAGTVGAKDVVVTNNDGQTATKANAYTYLSAPTFTSISPAAGPITVGTPITITGTNLIGTTSVTLGGTAATAITVVSDTRITAIAPAHAAGLVNVVVTTPGGTATGTGAYMFTAAPTFTAIAPLYGRTAGGTSVTLTGTNFVTGATAVTFDGVAAPTFTVVSATQITATTPADAGAATVTVTTPGGAPTRPYTFADPTISGALSRITGAHGSTYTLITIPGNYFITSPYPTVTFIQGSNTMTGTVTACTQAQVTFSVTIPAGQATGLYDVRVTNTDGGSATRTSAFTVT